MWRISGWELVAHWPLDSLSRNLWKSCRICAATCCRGGSLWPTLGEALCSESRPASLFCSRAQHNSSTTADRKLGETILLSPKTECCTMLCNGKLNSESHASSSSTYDHMRMLRLIEMLACWVVAFNGQTSVDCYKDRPWLLISFISFSALPWSHIEYWKREHLT